MVSPFIRCRFYSWFTVHIAPELSLGTKVPNLEVRQRNEGGHDKALKEDGDITAVLPSFAPRIRGLFRLLSTRSGNVKGRFSVCEGTSLDHG